MDDDHDIQEAREALERRIMDRTIWAELAEDPSGAVPMVMMGLVLGFPAWGVILALFGDGRAPMGSDIFAVAIIGFLISTGIASRMGNKAKKAKIEWLRREPVDLIARRYCETFHPEEHADLWQQMDRIRRSR